MHRVRTPWPVATRVQYIVAFQECQRRWGLSARRFCAVAEVPYPTFARWWALWRRQGKYALLDRPRRPRRSPGALPGQALSVIRRTHWSMLYNACPARPMCLTCLETLHRLIKVRGHGYNTETP